MRVRADDNIRTGGDGGLGHGLLRTVVQGLVFRAPMAGIEDDLAALILQGGNVPGDGLLVLIVDELPAPTEADLMSVDFPNV